MNLHRLASASSISPPVCTDPPFSNFDFVDSDFGGVPSIRRIFSQARSYGCRTLVVEDIPATGVLEEDNGELLALFPRFRLTGLKRLSFWKTPLTSVDDVSDADPESLLGFAILKRDSVSPRHDGSWYVFESVIVKYPHRHNCVPGAAEFSVRVGDSDFRVPGVLYCQQNGLNKACAQVALRSLLATRNPGQDLSYGQINQWAAQGAPGFEPWRGLSVPEIGHVLSASGIGFLDIDYRSRTPEEREQLPPYQKLVYAGIESGGGALLGFRLSGEGLTEEVRHIIPLFGHTFNQDAWVPRAEAAYFHIGENTRYLPSESWVSSFIGHDDNFASNFCVPRLYIPPGQADYVAELFPSECVYSGTLAEAVAVDYLYSVLPELAGSPLPWLRRLVAYVQGQEVVLRAISVTADEYVRHWKRLRDWEGQAEDEALCDALEPYLPERLWMVEISVPELFPANLHKVGEIVLDAVQGMSTERDFRLFVFARVPGRLLLVRELSPDGTPSFASVPSSLQSHTPLYEAAAGAP